MNNLKVGFSREIINPKMGAPINGYSSLRYADGILDDLEINTISIASGDKTVVIMAFDSCQLMTPVANTIRDDISKATNLPKEAVFLCATHTHTAPVIEDEYFDFLREKSVSAAKAAIADLTDAKMGFKQGKAENIAFIRRFRMKNGGVQTNPGVGNPEIKEPLGTVDERVNVVRFDRKDKETIVLVNFGNHPDTVGGSKISADWPGFLRRTVEKAIDNTRCLFMNGAEGDVNHINVNAKGGDLNGTFNDFDDVYRGYEHTRFMGRAMAGAVLQVFDKVDYADTNEICFGEQSVEIPSNMPKPEEIEKAKLYWNLHLNGRDDEIPLKGMELTTAVFEARRMVTLENGPENFPVLLHGIRIGDIAVLGVQGEPFTGVGLALKETPGYKMILPVCSANGKEGYFPMMQAYNEGGYEARSSNFKAGVAEKLIDEGTALLKKLNETDGAEK